MQGYAPREPRLTAPSSTQQIIFSISQYLLFLYATAMLFVKWPKHHRRGQHFSESQETLRATSPQVKQVLIDEKKERDERQFANINIKNMSLMYVYLLQTLSRRSEIHAREGANPQKS